MNIKKFCNILALLFAGSAGMLAQEGSDPFPDVPYNNWQGSMTVTGKVMLNGVALGNEAVVAAYNGEQIRGKQCINTKGILYLSVGGDAADRNIPLHFKVYTGSHVVEIDQGLTFQWEGEFGSASNPYLINLTVVTTNTSKEGWATTCLPYNAVVPEGVTVFSASRIEDGVLKIEPVECTILPKETPVLLKTENQTNYEWLARVADGDAVIETNLFTGTTEAKAVEAGSVLTLGHATDGNKAIGFWRFNGTTVPANRAYLESSVAAEVRGVTIDWDGMAAGIGEVKSERVKSERVKSEKCAETRYDLSGRKIRHASSIISHPSFVILNGKKIFMR